MDKGVLPSQRLREAVSREWLVAGDWRILPESVQPASVDLRLGDHAWALRCSFLPDSHSTVEEKVEDVAFDRIDLRDGATLERDRPYLVPLVEELRLPQEIRAKANPKSSTGRLDVFTRVIDRPQSPLRRDRGRAITAGSTSRSSRARSRSASRPAWRSTRCG